MTADILKISDFRVRNQTTSQTQVELPGKNDASGINQRKFINVNYLQQLIITLNAIFEEAKKPGWDGNNAEPISDSTYFNTIKMLTVLDAEISIPELLPDNDGYIEFEWQQERKNFSLYITDSNLILYAGYYNKDDRLSGRFYFEDIFPRYLLPLINRVYEKT